MRQVLSMGAQSGRPQEHKGVHAALKQRLHCPKQRNLLVCTAADTLLMHVSGRHSTQSFSTRYHISSITNDHALCKVHLTWLLA